MRAPADGWVTNLNVRAGEYITWDSDAVMLMKNITFYILAYLKETELNGLNMGDRLKIIRLGSSRIMYGTVDSVAAAVNNSSTVNSKSLASIDSNLEWAC